MTEVAAGSYLDDILLRRARKAARRTRGVPRSYWFSLPQEYRRQHVLCCIGSMTVCPFCGGFDPNQNDGCKPMELRKETA